MFIVGLQPLCTRTQFEESCQGVLTGEYRSIGNAVFDAYLDRVNSIEESDQFIAAKKAAGILFEFTQSLAVLGGHGEWKSASGDLYRSVLLQSRQSANPLPATLWVDLSTIRGVVVSSETNDAIDNFLRVHYEDDLRERFEALAAMRVGNLKVCKQLTEHAMARWSQYQEIVEHYMTKPEVRYAAFPTLNTGQDVKDAGALLREECTNSSTLEKLNKRQQRWAQWHSSQLQATLAMVRTARSTYKFDPWSPRCGIPANKRATELMHQLLQLSAAVRDKNQIAISELQEIARTP